MIFFYHQEVFPQETKVSSDRKAGLFFGLSAGQSFSQIINDGSQSFSKPLFDILAGRGEGTRKYSTLGSLEIGYFFSNSFGLSTGVGFNSYRTGLTLDSYQNKYNTTDSENDAYERQVSGSDILEEQNIDYLSVPISINIRLALGKTFGFFLQTGASLAVPLNKNYKSSGTFTYKGFYPAYNVLLEDLPAYGFPSNASIKSEGELEIKTHNFSAFASAGFDLFFRKKIQIGVAACYDRSLSNISNYSSPDSFQLSSDTDQINSLMGESSKVTAHSIGLKVIFRYYLKKKKVENT